MSVKINLTKEFLIEEYSKNKKTIYQIAKETGYTGTGIWHSLIRHGISIRKKYYSKILTKEFLIKEYIVNKKTTIQIAKQIGCVSSTVFQALKFHGIKMRTIGESKLGKPRPDLTIRNRTIMPDINLKYDKILTKDFLIKEYIILQKSTIKIAQEVGCGARTVQLYLKIHDIKTRTVLEAIKIAKLWYIPCSGKDHWNWNNGSSFEPYPIGWSKILKESIRVRDNHVCQICGKKQKI